MRRALGPAYVTRRLNPGRKPPDLEASCPQFPEETCPVVEITGAFQYDTELTEDVVIEQSVFVSSDKVAFYDNNINALLFIVM
jgi:hypothetical protein